MRRVYIPKATTSVARKVAGPVITGMVVGCVIGAGVAAQPHLTIAVVGGLAYVALARAHLLAAVALWVPLLFFEGIPPLNLAAKAAAVVIAVVWCTTLDPSAVRELGVRHRRPVIALVLLLGWVTMSVVWASDRGVALISLWHWYVAALLLVVVPTTCRDARDVRFLATSFVTGGVLTTVAAPLAGFSTGSGSAAGRFVGGAGDPNFLAAWLLAACVLALGLGYAARSWGRAAAALAAVALAVGVAATVSRGALVAAALTAAAAVVVVRGARLPLVALLSVVGIAALVWVQSSSLVAQRLSEQNGGSGRLDLWAVAWRMFVEHPVQGIGLENFASLGTKYMREVHPLVALNLVTSSPHEAHNTYIQLAAELGAVGLALFLWLLAECAVTALRAARSAEVRGDRREAGLAYGVLLAIVAMAGACLFLSAAADSRWWFLLGLSLAVKDLAMSGPWPTAPGRATTSV